MWELSHLMFEKLGPLGLTLTESKIYVMLVDLGRSQAGIISRKTGIHRRSVYDALERLIEKGLVSYIKENEKRFYVPTDPQHLLELLKHTETDLQTVLPSLKAKYAEAKQKQETLFYRGVEGIKAIFDDQIATGKDVSIMGAARNAPEILKYYLGHYTEKRLKKNIKLQLIYAGKKNKETVPNAEIKYLPDEFASPVSTNVYGDKVAIIVWGVEPVAILIKSKEIAQAYHSYFSLLWSLAK